jgi:hypothetical protein
MMSRHEFMMEFGIDDDEVWKSIMDTKLKLSAAGFHITVDDFANVMRGYSYNYQRPPVEQPQPIPAQPAAKSGLSWTWVAVIVAGCFTFLCCALLFAGMVMTELEGRGSGEPLLPVPTMIITTPMPEESFWDGETDFPLVPPFGEEEGNE